MALGDDVRVDAGARILARGRDRVAGRDRLGLGELLVELALEVAQSREVLVEPRAVSAPTAFASSRVSSRTPDSTLLRAITRALGVKASAFGSW